MGGWVGGRQGWCRRTCPGLWAPLQLVEGLPHTGQLPAHGVRQLNHIKLHRAASPCCVLRWLPGQAYSQGGTPMPGEETRDWQPQSSFSASSLGWGVLTC